MAKSRKKTKKTIKRAPKKVVQKRKVSKKNATQSFMIQRDNTPFMSFKITDQTVYWLVLSLAILLLGFWVLKIQIDLVDLLDTIEANL